MITAINFIDVVISSTVLVLEIKLNKNRRLLFNIICYRNNQCLRY